MENDLILADLIDGVPHPGEAHPLIGHDSRVSSLLQQYASGRMHHALLLTGGKGIGKATFALRLAGHILRHPVSETAPLYPASILVDDVVQARIAARSHPNLLHLTRPWDQKSKKFKTRLTVEEVRQTVHFFGTARAEEGWRIAIVDALDDMNASANNALLKILEEPPDRTVFFVIAHSIGAVMPTIRSRCQHIAMKPLTRDELIRVLGTFGIVEQMDENDQETLIKLSEGSVRRAITLIQEDGLELYKSFVSVCSNLSNPDWGDIHAIADSISLRGREDRFRLFLNFAFDFVREKATALDAANNSISSLARWAEVWEKSQNSTRIADSYNLDRKQVILNLFQDMGEAARA